MILLGLESAKRHRWCANMGGVGSVGALSSWVHGSKLFWHESKFFRCGSNFFAVGQIFFWRGSNFFRLVSIFFGVDEKCFGVGQFLKKNLPGNKRVYHRTVEQFKKLLLFFLENKRPLYQRNEKHFSYRLCNHWTSFQL